MLSSKRLLNEPPTSDIIPTMQTATLDELHADPYRLDGSIDEMRDFENGRFSK